MRVLFAKCRLPCDCAMFRTLSLSAAKCRPRKSLASNIFFKRSDQRSDDLSMRYLSLNPYRLRTIANSGQSSVLSFAIVVMFPIRKTIIKVATCLAAVVGCPRAAKHHSAPSFTGNILVFVESVVELVNQDEEGAWNAPYLCYIPRFERSITTISLNQTLTENMNDNHPIPMCERLGCNGGWSASAKPKTLRIQVDWDNKCGGFEFAELAEAKADLTASHEYMVECFVALITEKTRQLFEPTN